MKLDKASGLNEKTTGRLTLCHHLSQAAMRGAHTHKLGWKFIGVGEWGCFLPRVTHADCSHGCYWRWRTSFNGRYWDESFRSSAHPQSTKALPGWWMLGGGRKVVGDSGGVCKCVSGWPRALYRHAPPFSLPLLLLIILSVNLCRRPDTTLTLTPLLFRLCAVCRCTSLIMWVRASSAVSCAHNALTTQPVRPFVNHDTGKAALTRGDRRIPNQGHQHLGEFNSLQASCTLNSRSWAHAVHHCVVHLSSWLSCAREEDNA